MLALITFTLIWKNLFLQVDFEKTVFYVGSYYVYLDLEKPVFCRSVYVGWVNVKPVFEGRVMIKMG